MKKDFKKFVETYFPTKLGVEVLESHLQGLNVNFNKPYNGRASYLNNDVFYASVDVTAFHLLNGKKVLLVSNNPDKTIKALKERFNIEVDIVSNKDVKYLGIKLKTS